MRSGELVAGRFEVEAHVGSGGMGSVHRARDRETGALVALKRLRITESDAARRFLREAELLAQLRHPGIVAYVAHGLDEAGEPYLAMAWIEGEDLAHRLARGPLDEADAQLLARACLGGLEHAHGLGMVHRDLKPGNIRLPDGDFARATLVDFGVARLLDHTALTRPGGVVGTPGYMAPEQARGEDAIDARADLFALGCVLFECVVGRPAFLARDALAVLFRLLVEDPGAPHHLRPDISPRFSRFVARMMQKEPVRRPQSAAAAMALLDDATVADVTDDGSAQALTGLEQRMVCVVVAAGQGDGTTISGAEATAPSDDERAARSRVRQIASEYGARCQWLADGGMVAVLRDVPLGAADQAVLAARCALALRAAVPALPLAIGTGRAELRAALPVGPVLDRAVELLREARGGGDAPILVDDTTRHLLEQRFEMAGDRLVGTRAAPGGGRTLLGRPSVCVGRDRELAQLEELVDRAVEDRAAGAALVIGPAGIGKSRLVHELLGRVRARHPHATSWQAAADPVRGAAPLALIAEALAGADIADDRADIRALLAELRAAAAPATAASPAGATSAASRVDPSAAANTAEQLRRGFLELVAATCARGPLVVVLEDVHWADAASLRFLDDALGELATSPLAVVAAARPEIRDLSPRLWERRHLVELRLSSLRARPAADLVRHALGDGVDDATVARIVDRAEGNPFFLEELVRAVADGRVESLPDTVLAMALARLENLDGEARRLLRAGSVYGEIFTAPAAAALVDAEPGALADLTARLDHLVHVEALAGIAGDGAARRYRFRHAFLRDAAYSTLTDADRMLGHRLAAGFLEAEGGAEPAVLAEHLERGGDARAASWYFTAARQALRRSDPDEAVRLAERGEKLAPPGDRVRDELLRMLAGIHGWRGDFPASAAVSDRMMALARPGSRGWWIAASGAVFASVFLGDRARLRRNLRRFYDTAPAPDAMMVYGRAVAAALPSLINACLHPEADTLLQRFRMGAAPMAANDPFVRAMLIWLDSNRAFFRDDDAWTAMALNRQAIPLFMESGDTQRAYHLQGENAMYLGDVGDIAAQVAENARVLTLTSHMGLGPVLGLSVQAYNLARLGRVDEARDGMRWALERAETRGFAIGEGIAHAAAAAIALVEHDPISAERHAVAAAQRACTIPRYAAFGYALLIKARLAQGAHARAIRAGRAGLAMIARHHGHISPSDLEIRAAYVEALDAAGDRATADPIAADAAARVDARAATIDDAGARATYLASPVVRAVLARRPAGG